jgi:esterase/lipase
MLKKRAALPIPPCDALTPQGSAIRDTAAQAAAGATIEIAEGARYSRLPLRWSVELQRIRAEAQRAASAVKCPVMLLHGRLDGTAHPESSLLAARWFSTACHVRFFERSPHVLSLGPERGIIAADVAEFLSRRCEIAGAAQSA